MRRGTATRSGCSSSGTRTGCGRWRCASTCDPDDAADALQEAMISAFRRAWRLPRRVRGDDVAAPDGGQRRHWTCYAAGRPARSAGRATPMTCRWPRPWLAQDSDRGRRGSRLDVDAAHSDAAAAAAGGARPGGHARFPVADAAVILGVSEGTVKSRCARGRARLSLLGAFAREPIGEPERLTCAGRRPVSERVMTA